MTACQTLGPELASFRDIFSSLSKRCKTGKGAILQMSTKLDFPAFSAWSGEKR